MEVKEEDFKKELENKVVANPDGLSKEVLERIILRRNVIAATVLKALADDSLKVACESIEAVREEVTAVMQALALVIANSIIYQHEKTNNPVAELYEYHCDSVMANLNAIDTEEEKNYTAEIEKVNVI